jgi:predicted ATPase
MSLKIGDTIGDYQVIELLGAGGMGKVYKVRNLISDRVEAAKILLPDLGGEPELAERFMREIKVQASLNHPYIASLHTALRVSNQLVMVMELLEGATLDVRIGQSPIPIPEGVRYMCQVLEALSYAHARGVVHRDIKPGNIMIMPDGTIKLMDFGIARPVSKGQLTMPGMAIGSAGYMAPEQVKGAPPDPRSDLYSVGVTLYEIATGQRPFQGENDYAIMTAQLQRAPRPPREINPALPAGLPEVILKSLTKSPADRFQSAEEFRSGLLPFIGEKPKRASEPVVSAVAPQRVFVGRKSELTELAAGYESAASGAGKFFCVSGEPGMGKTALVEHFLAGLTDNLQPYALARGRCSERLSEAEPYRSVFEALETLLAGVEGPSFRSLLAETAPTWLKQLTPGEEGDPASQERMIREATSFLQHASRALPLILFLDDLQWADVSTLDLLLDLSSRLDKARILVVGTYRPHERAAGKDTFHHAKLQLQHRGCFREITLDFLSAGECQRYLDMEFGGAKFPAEFSSLVSAKTAGNPLFLVELVRFMRDTRFVVEEGGGWKLARPSADLRDQAPESIQAMIRAKLDLLSDDERQLLVAASVQGVDFDSAVIAKALGLDQADVEDRLDATQRTRGIVQSAGELELPEGTLTVRYRFVQAPDHQALYGSLKPARRASLSAAVAEAVVAFHGKEAKPVTAQIALLFETARKFDRAAEYFRLSAVNAAHVGASHEAITLARRGLALLDKMSNNADRGRQELSLRMTLGGPLTLASFGSPETRENYVRAQQLCSDLGDTAQLLPALWGLWLSDLAEAKLQEARDLARQILDIAEQDKDPARLVAAHWAMGTTLGNLGEIAAAKSHFERGIELYDPGQHEYYATVYGFDPGVACRVELGGRFLWLLGFPDQALQMIREAQDLARRLAHPPSVTFALTFEAVLRHLRGEPDKCLECAAEVLGDERSPSNLRAWAALCRGWALVSRGELGPGIEQIQQSLAAHQAIGSSMGRPHFLAVEAEALGRAGNVAGGLVALGDAFEVMKATGQRYYEAELSRLSGELFLKSSEKETAEYYFQEALRIAHDQAARSLELRAAIKLASLWRSQGKQNEAVAVLSGIYGSFQEGFETHDMSEAKALIDAMR